MFANPVGELAVVGRAHVGKTLITGLRGADERVAEHQVQMIAYEHQIARTEGAADPAGGIRHEQHRNAERVQHANGKARQRRVVPLVHVEASRERDDGTPAEEAADERSCMAHDRRGGKARHFREWDGDGVRDSLSQPSKA